MKVKLVVVFSLVFVSLIFGVRKWLYTARITTKDLATRMYVEHTFPTMVMMLAQDIGKNPPGNIRDILKLIREHNSPEDFDMLIDGRCSVDMKKYEIRDCWGNPLRFSVDEAGKYTILSCGENGIFENGQGDDISHSFTVD